MDVRQTRWIVPMALSLALLFLVAGCSGDDEDGSWSSFAPPESSSLPTASPPPSGEGASDAGQPPAEGEGSAAEDPPPDDNRPPVAITAADPQAKVFYPITLDAGDSSDPDGDPLFFEWRLLSQPDGSDIQISSPFSATPSFTPLVTGDYRFLLLVSDDCEGVATDLVTVTAWPLGVNIPPVADAGTDQSATVGEMVRFEGGGSFDPDGDILFYEWRLAARPLGSFATLIDRGSPAALLFPDAAGEYRVQLTVRDPAGAAAYATVVLYAAVSGENLPPVAEAGKDLLVDAGSPTALDGRASFDPEGEPLFFSWSVAEPDGGDGNLTGADTPTPAFTPDFSGSYRLILTVRDIRGAVGTDTVLIIAR